MLALIACLPLLAFELIYVFAVCRPQLEGGQAVALTATLAGLLFCTAALIGALEGLVIVAVSSLAERLATQRLAQPRWIAALYTLLSAPLLSYGVAQAFAGRRAQQIWGRHVIALGVGLLALALTYLVVRLVVAARDRFRLRRWTGRQALPLLILALLGAGALYLVDQRVLRRLYGFFHLGLALGAALLAQLAVATIHAGWRPTSRLIGRILEPQVATLLLVAAVASGAFALDRASRSQALRFAIDEHSVLGGKLLRAASWMRLLRRRGPAKAAAAKGSVRGGAALPAGPRVKGASVLLITIDALRADHLGCYGYRRKTSPAVDAFAREAVLFRRAYCPTPHTSFAISSLHTGRSMVSALAARQTLARSFRRQGYKTGAFFPPAVFYIDGDRFRAFRERRYDFEWVKLEYLPAKKRVDQVQRYLKMLPATQPVFLWVHFFEPHEPYEARPPHRFGTRPIDRYDGEIAYVDQQIGRLLTIVRARRPKLVVALSADHGEAFGEHGGHYHGTSVYDEQVRIPLLIAAPGVEPRQVEGPAQLHDLAPTLLRLVGFSPPETMRGTDLGPWLAGASAQRLPSALVELRHKKALVGVRYKLIEDSRLDFAQLYDLRADPAERKNLVSARPALLAQLRQALQRRLVAPRIRAGGHAARILAQARAGDPGAAASLIELAKGGTRQQRRDALTLLLGLRVRAARSVMIAAMSSKDPPQRIVGTVGAALFGHRAALAKLSTVLARVDLPPALSRAGQLARALELRDKASAAPLIAMLEGEKDVYKANELIDALGVLGATEAQAALLARLKALRTRPAAIRALGLIRAKEAVPALLKILREGRFVVWRYRAAQALGRIGDPRGRPLLQTLAERSRDRLLVAHALPALAALGGLPVPGTRLVDEATRCAAGQELLLVLGKGCSCTVRCGAELVSTVTDVGKTKRDPSWGAVVPLRRAGVLRIETKGSCALLYASLRPTPSPTATPTQPDKATKAP